MPPIDAQGFNYMKERPILFSGEMVKAILAGNKTQTRRVIKVRGKYSCGEPSVHSELNGELKVWKPERVDYSGFVECPYGQPGDLLWVRETWATSIACDDRPPSDMEKAGRGYGWPVWYAADGMVNTRRADPVPQGGIGFTTMGKCRPSIFMPRWASRITLEIESVRVERLQDISEEDAISEGVEHVQPLISAKEKYQELWESINGKGSWDENPWLWVIQFNKL
jgi:hypothetical protein